LKNQSQIKRDAILSLFKKENFHFEEGGERESIMFIHIIYGHDASSKEKGKDSVAQDIKTEEPKDSTTQEESETITEPAIQNKKQEAVD
jgi:hypothetical protein